MHSDHLAMRIRLQYPGFLIDLHPDEQVKTTLYSSDFPPFWAIPSSKDSSMASFYAIDSRHFSLIPAELYDPEYQKSYLIQLGMDNNCRAAESYVPQWKAYLVYSLENDIHGEEPNYILHSVWEGLFAYAFFVFKDSSQNGLVVHVTPNQLYLIGGDIHTLQFFNSFSVRDPLDCLYFILQAIERVKIDTPNIPVWLSGQFVEDSQLYKLLEQYIKNLSLAPASPVQLPGLTSEPPHQYGDLSSFVACVSSVAD